MPIDEKEALEELIERYQKVERYRKVKGDKLSEIDTQVLLIEPVLMLAGWNLLDHEQIKRASRNSRGQEFDIGVYSSTDTQHVMFAIECKALGNAWCNLKKLSSTNGVGQLTKKGNRWMHDYNKCDGVGQLRAYCMNYEERFSKGTSTAILTDGYDWGIFNNQALICDSGSLGSRVSEKDVTHRNLESPDFNEEIVKRLRRTQ